MRWLLSPLVWLALLVAGIGLSAYGGTLNARDPNAPRLFFAGVAVALVALVMLVVAWRSGRNARRRALTASPDAIARWQIYPSDMASFNTLDAERAGRLWSLKNALTFPRAIPPEGIPVVVGQSSLVIGDTLYETGIHYYGIPGDVRWFDGTPGFIEICLFLPGDKKRTHISTLRIPVPAAARNDAAPAYAHLASLVRAEDQAHIHTYFAAHFEAAGQATDAPHRMQRRRRIVFPILGLFILAMLIIVFLRPF
jgi:hypothetical protein